jgi:Domain of unknown function (DUF1906)
MRADHLPWIRRHGRKLAGAAVLATLSAATGLATSGPAAASTGPGIKRVSYAGYHFQVPRSWPVVNLRQHPRTCVRFDKHVVYLGASGADQDCPSSLIGTTEAVQLAPSARGTRRSSVEDPTGRLIAVTAPRLQFTATFGDDPTAISLILASARLPAPSIQMPHPVRLPAPGVPGAEQVAPPVPAAVPRRKAGPNSASRPATVRFPGVSPPALPANVANFRGRGFDACTAPSRRYMAAWRKHSSYRAIGIYIGGSDRACGQRNLTTSWLRDEAAAGWHFFPMYVGPQAAYHQLSSPARQARRAADDAAAQAERLGFGPRTPIYYDMEAFRAKQTGKVLRFSTAWTKRLHYLGYEAGVYSSSGSGITQLARHYRSHSLTMPDVIYDALWNGSKNTKDSVLGRQQWQGRRLHQYAGNVTQSFGGAKINIDKDYLNVVLPTPGGTAQGSRATSQPDGTVDVFYRGAGHRLWHAEVRPGGVSAPARLGGHLIGQPAAVAPVPGALDVFFEGTDHKLWEVSRKPGRPWSAPRQLSRMSTIGSPPSAVAQPNGVVDVFWKGSADNGLWHGQFSPGKGWRGPQGLGGSLVSQPSPVESAPGTVQVFWKGKDLALWHVIRRPGRTWTRAARLGMGPLGGAPHATANRGGAIGVFWHGAGNGDLWGTTFSPGHRWAGPLRLGGPVRSTPFPLMSPSGAVHVLWRGPGRKLWLVTRGPGGHWQRPSLAGVSRVSAGPAAAIGPGGKIAVFWRGSGRHLWFTAQSKGKEWGVPRNLGGRVA